MLDTRDYTFNASYLQEDKEQEPFESDNLTECLDYYSETKDREPLENSIKNAETIIELQIKELQMLIDLTRQTKNTYIANKLIAVRKKLDNLLIKNY